MELSEAPIPEILAELSRRGTTYSGMGNLVKWADNSSGSFVRFAIDMFDEDGELMLTESPFKGCCEGAKDGQTFYITATMTTREKLKPNEGSEVLVKPSGESEVADSSHNEYKSLSRMAHVLFKNPDFEEFLFAKLAVHVGEEEFYLCCDADEALEKLLGIDSMTELKRPEVQEAFRLILKEYDKEQFEKGRK